MRFHLPRKVAWVGQVLFLAPLAFLVLWPLLQLQKLALADGGRAYSALGSIDGFSSTLVMTMALALGSLVIAVPIGTILAWHSLRLPRRLGWMRILPIIPIALPAVALVTGWAFLIAPRGGYLNVALRSTPFFDHLKEGPIDVYQPLWIVIITGVGLISFMFIFTSAGLESMNHETVEAARISGASPRVVLQRIVIPILRPSVLYGASVCLMLALGQFTAPLLLGTREGVRVLSTEVYRFSAQSPIDFGLSAAVASPLLLAGAAIFATQRYLLRNPRRYGGDVNKGGRLTTETSWVAPVVILVFATFAVFLPLAALIYVALSPFYSGSVNLSALTLDNVRQLWDTIGVRQSVVTSVLASVLGVVISLPLGYVAADMLHNPRGRVRSVITEAIVSLPLAVPAVVFGAGFLIAYTGRPFVLYGTEAIVVLLYAALMLPFATRFALAARISAGDSYSEASRISGAGLLRTHLAIVLPMMRVALASAAALIFVLLSHEFAASLLVRSTNLELMGTMLYRLWETSTQPLVAAMALLMCLITAIGVGVALRVGGGKALSKL